MDFQLIFFRCLLLIAAVAALSISQLRACQRRRILHRKFIPPKNSPLLQLIIVHLPSNNLSIKLSTFSLKSCSLILIVFVVCTALDNNQTNERAREWNNDEYFPCPFATAHTADSQANYFQYQYVSFGSGGFFRPIFLLLQIFFSLRFFICVHAHWQHQHILSTECKKYSNTRTTER